MLVERPTYDRPLKILRELGAEIVGLPTATTTGLDPDALEAALRERRDAGVPLPDPDLPEPERPHAQRASAAGAIVELAREHDLLVLEDDPYGLVRYEGEPLPSLLRARPAASVAYSSSFSKTIAPGLRVGWFVLPRGARARDRGDRDRRRTSRRCCSARRRCTSSSAAASSSRTSSASSACCARAATRCSPRSTASCPTCATTRPEGGYFLWLELDGVDAAELLAARRGGGRHVRPGHRLRRRAGHAAARVQLRLARRDRRGRLAARGRSLALSAARPEAVQLRERARRARSRRRARAGSPRSARRCVEAKTKLTFDVLRVQDDEEQQVDADDADADQPRPEARLEGPARPCFERGSEALGASARSCWSSTPASLYATAAAETARAARGGAGAAAAACASRRGRWGRDAPASSRRGRDGGSSSRRRSERSVGSCGVVLPGAARCGLTEAALYGRSARGKRLV